MIKGIGIDIIELSRIQDLLQRQRKFIDRILTDREKQKFEVLSNRRQVEFLAGRFAAKEAFSKAVGTGIGKELSFLDIEIGSDPYGKPIIIKPDVNAHLSISHSREYAVAQVVIESKHEIF
ncbi:holo-ACP synthase [Bacillus xiapuensis]|uniref:Holo-[acyl-carrier-protein] synthase n=1 Tax=Bacillus xiapuensis TaxID=2014075 RepID=A0ABU6N5S1_9BACI|nr:holo-ACP synthase [Bacillus xiapuensis]